MLQTIEQLSSMDRYHQTANSKESDFSLNSASDTLVLDERCVASRASFVESKLVALRQRADRLLKRTRKALA
jgi:ElaB/YqjD/DUF883 family membrane-anchored ribosome-binding protein